MKNRFKGIRKNTKFLLDSGESSIVDFKTNSKFDQEDLVAFANTEAGGTILLGIAEEKDSNGRMYGVPVGCALTDKLFQTIENKATNCIPPISIEVSEENTNSKPFIRIDIPSSPERPHCTGSGTYKIRGQIKNTALVPSALLEMLINKESARFYEQFSESTEGLIKRVHKLERNLSKSLESIVDDIGSTQDRLQESLGSIHDMAEESFCQAEEANLKSEESNNILYNLSKAGDDIQPYLFDVIKKIDSLIIHSKAKDISLPIGQIATRIALSLMDGMSKEDIISAASTDYPTLCQESLNEAFEFAETWQKKSAKRKKRT